MASNAENVSIWWRHHDNKIFWLSAVALPERWKTNIIMETLMNMVTISSKPGRHQSNTRATIFIKDKDSGAGLELYVHFTLEFFYFISRKSQ